MTVRHLANTGFNGKDVVIHLDETVDLRNKWFASANTKSKRYYEANFLCTRHNPTYSFSARSSIRFLNFEPESFLSSYYDISGKQKQTMALLNCIHLNAIEIFLAKYQILKLTKIKINSIIMSHKRVGSFISDNFYLFCMIMTKRSRVGIPCGKIKATDILMSEKYY